MKTTKGKIKIYEPLKGRGSYICYYKGHSIDVFGVNSPKAAIRLVNKLIKKGEL